jgi:hypothetical protein
VDQRLVTMEITISTMDVQDVSQHSVETDSSIHLRMEAQNNAMTEIITQMIFV